MLKSVVVALSLSVLAAASASAAATGSPARGGAPRFSRPAPSHEAKEAYLASYGTPLPSSANCTTLWFTQTLDHFSASPGTYQQRYFVCLDDDDAGRVEAAEDTPTPQPQDRPVFFYCGNEANVSRDVGGERNEEG